MNYYAFFHILRAVVLFLISHKKVVCLESAAYQWCIGIPRRRLMYYRSARQIFVHVDSIYPSPALVCASLEVDASQVFFPALSQVTVIHYMDS